MPVVGSGTISIESRISYIQWIIVRTRKLPFSEYSVDMYLLILFNGYTARRQSRGIKFLAKLYIGALECLVLVSNFASILFKAVKDVLNVAILGIVAKSDHV